MKIEKKLIGRSGHSSRGDTKCGTCDGAKCSEDIYGSKNTCRPIFIYYFRDFPEVVYENPPTEEDYRKIKEGGL